MLVLPFALIDEHINQNEISLFIVVADVCVAISCHRTIWGDQNAPIDNEKYKTFLLCNYFTRFTRYFVRNECNICITVYCLDGQ